MKIKKLSLFLVLCFMVLVVSGCDKPKTADYVTDLSIASLTGLGTENSPYLVEMKVGESKDYQIIVTSNDKADKTLAYSVVSLTGATDTAAINVTDSAGQTLKINGVSAGTVGIKVTATDQNKISIYLKVVVTAEATVSVTSIYLPCDEGSGTLASPYLETVAYSQSKDIAYTVRPTNATNKEVEWTVGKIDNGTFEVMEEVAVSVVATTTKITVTGLVKNDTAVIKGTTKDGSGIDVYIQVSVEDFTAVTAITSTALLEGETTDYLMKTAKGTQWDMSGSELARKTGLINGTDGPGAGQAAEDMTYWPSLYNIGIVVGPEDASNPAILVDYDEEGIIRINTDGTYEALRAGTTVVTISSVSNPEVEMTIEVTVEDTIYPGILSDAFEALPVSNYSEWNFDNNPDNLATRPLLVEWQLVQMQTNSTRGMSGSDGNQKMFYLGTADRVYGICLESRVDLGDVNKTTALAWNKVAISESATTIDITIGNNDKVHNQYKITIVLDDGTIYVVRDWTSLTTPNGSSKIIDIEIPDEVKGQTVALVVEQRLTEANNNGELHIKGIWINQYTPVTSVTLNETAGTVGQGGSTSITGTVVPTNATNKTVIYSVDPTNKGVTVDSTGRITVATDAEVGIYTIYAMSAEDPNIRAEYTLTVESNVPTNEFGFSAFEDGDNLTATYHDGTNVNHTDTPIRLIAVFNEGASNVEYTSVITGTSVVIENNAIKFVSVGESTIVFTASGNQNLTVTININVLAYDEENSSIIAGINKTEATNMLASTEKLWNSAALARQWVAETVDKSHGGSKIAEYGEADGKMILEGHSTVANIGKAINIVWNKLAVSSTDKSFVFEVHSHDDDRVLESTNFRVLVINLDDFSVDELIGWTTVANRWKQQNAWFKVALDVTAYQGQEVVVVIEQTGSLQNNGNWVLNSDSGAGAYLHLRGLSLSNEVAPAVEDLYAYYAYAKTDENLSLASGWYANAYYYNKNYVNNYGGAYDEEGNPNPLVITYKNSLENATGLTLPTVSMFINNGSAISPIFYTWGLYPALNNSHVNNNVAFELEATDVVSLVDGVLTPLKEGTVTLNMILKAYADDTNVVTFPITIVVKYEQQVDPDDPVDPVVKTIWANKGEILENWNLTEGSNWDSGVGEGVDLHIDKGTTGWSSIYYTVTLTADTAMLTYGARVFHRDGEVYPHFVVKVNGVIVNALGSETEYVFVDTDEIQTFSYDLSAYIDQETIIEIGITEGTHAVITNIALGKLPTRVWDGKAAIVNDWILTEGSQWDPGVGEGYDLKVGHGEGWSAISNTFSITSYWNQLSFSARVFHRDGETYPQFVVKVNGTIVKAIDATNDYVYVDTDDFQTFTYDLSSYAGQEVTIELGITTGTHAVVGNITIS